MAQLAPMQRGALEGVRRAAERKAKAEAEYLDAVRAARDAIRAAVDKRVPMRAVAAAADLSLSRVHQIVHRSDE